MEVNVIEKYQIKSYPTFMWFKNGVHHPYNGGITKDEIVKWVTKKSVSSSTLVDCETLKNKAE